MPDHVLPGPDLLDRGPRGLQDLPHPARSLAAWADRDDGPPQGHARPQALWRRRHGGAPVLRLLRADRPGAGVVRLGGLYLRRRRWRDLSAVGAGDTRVLHLLGPDGLVRGAA